MKIGIMTYWQTHDNYGQVLQCYALQQILKDMGHEPFVIRFSPKKKEHTSSLIRRIARILLFPLYLWRKRQRQKLYQEKMLLEKRRHFDDFRESNLKFSPYVYKSLKQLKKNPPTADCYIAGSDQVWGQLLSDIEIESYYLNFGDEKTKRISFAASFGMQEYPTELKSRLKQNLSRFDFISCREYDGVKICEDIGIPVERVIDPTLAANPNIYDVIIDKNTDKRKYIYLYSININEPEDLRFAELKRYAQKQNMEIIVTVGSGYFQGKEIYENVSYNYASIGQWLSNIQNASLVVTSSFHGIVFCILFHRPFVYVPLKGEVSKSNNRVSELLFDLGLQDHTLHDDTQYGQLATASFDWETVDRKLGKLRDAAICFLTNALA